VGISMFVMSSSVFAGKKAQTPNWSGHVVLPRN
jgi:hypothetical protein